MSQNYDLQVAFPRGIKGLIFDCDGVMFDSKAANIGYYNLILEALGLPRLSPEDEEYAHMHAWQETLNHVVPRERFVDLPKARQSIDYCSMVTPMLTPEPGLCELLEYMKSVGLPAAVHTNRSNSMEYTLNHFGMSHLFDVVMTAGVVAAKPSPEGIYVIQKAWQADMQDMAFLGDSELDQQAARAAGVPFWAYKNSKLDADWHVSDFMQVLQALKKLQR
ncbi:MAG: HAD hydrolase-like protein [Pseudomonadota bacterium]